MPTKSAADLEVERLRAALPKGPVTITVDKGLVTLTADKAWKITMLQELGKKVGFEAIGGGASNAPVTMKLERVPLAEAIDKIAGSDNYWLGYEYDPATKSQVLRNVLVGPKGLRAANVVRMRRMAKAAKEKQAEKERAEAAKRGDVLKERLESRGIDPSSVGPAAREKPAAP